jgi:hypothetical protein
MPTVDFNIELNELPIFAELQPEEKAKQKISSKREKRVRKHPSQKSTKK